MKELFLSFAPPEKWRDEQQTKWLLKSEEWKDIRKKILNRDDFSCVYCGYKSEKYQIVDHIDSNPENDNDNNLQIICQMCNLIKHSGQGVSLRNVVDLYKESKYSQNEIIRITREMRDNRKDDKEIILFLDLKNKAEFKMDKDYLKKLFGFITSRRALSLEGKGEMYNNWLDYYKNLK